MANTCLISRLQLYSSHTFREIIHHLKYADRVSLARPLGSILKQCLDSHDFKGEIIVPIPLHRSRERIRGVKQAELIAEGLGRPIARRLLRRCKDTPSQIGLTRSERKRNLIGAFETVGNVHRSVIVVNDVYKTGATMNEIARTLKRARADRVEVLRVARVAQDVYRAEDTDNSEGVSIIQ